MYLSKQWRESRILSAIALLGLALLLLLALKGSIKVGSTRVEVSSTRVEGSSTHVEGSSTHVQSNDQNQFGMIFIPIFYVEAVLIAFWGWLAGGIGAGKNLGEESGSFLFTRPRRRAWFLWNDWGFAMVQLAAIVLLTNLMVGLLAARMLTFMHSPGSVQLIPNSQPVPLFALMLLISIGVLLFAGLIYGLTYLCTIVLKRFAGVMLGAGILVAYLILRGLLYHYYPSIHPPDLIMNIFNFDHQSVYGLSGNLGLSIAARAVVMLLFPLAAQVILDRSEI